MSATDGDLSVLQTRISDLESELATVRSDALFITFEGGEGAGKTSVIQAVLRHLKTARIPHVATREPGGTAFGENIRGCVLRNTGTPVSPEAELLVMFAARAQHQDEVIEPSLREGVTVICDRYVDSSYAYQGGGRGMPAHQIKVLEQTFVRCHPNLTFYLDVQPEIGLARIAGRDADGSDRIESEHVTFFHAVRDAYLQRAAAEPKRFRVIDASKSPEDVASAVIREVDSAFGLSKR